MRCLVTGATGFVGSHLAEALAARGDDVTVFARPRSSRRWIDGLPVRVALGAFDDPAALEAAARSQDLVFHVAGVITAPRAAEYFQMNAGGTRRLVEACRRAGGVKRFLYVSSQAATGPSLDGRPVDETTPPHPVSPYGASKLAGEREVWAGGLPATVLRPSAVYGPRDPAMLTFFQLARCGLWVAVGERKYLSVVYISDLVDGVLRAADAPRAVGRTYLLTEGTYTHDDIGRSVARALGVPRRVRLRVPLGVLSTACLAFQALAACTGRPPPIRMLTRFKVREIRQTRWTCSAGLAERELGFAPRVTLDAGVERAARWYREHAWL